MPVKEGVGFCGSIDVEEDAHSRVVGETAERPSKSITAKYLQLKIGSGSVERVLRWVVEAQVHRIVVDDVIGGVIHGGLRKVDPSKVAEHLVNPLIDTVPRGFGSLEVWKEGESVLLPLVGNIPSEVARGVSTDVGDRDWSLHILLENAIREG